MFAASTLAIPLAAIPAQAAPDGSNVVISEVYVRGGSGGNLYRDYVELYNPTDAPVSLDGMSVHYFSAAGANSAGNARLSGTIAPGGYYMVLGGTSNAPGYADINYDAQGNLNISGTNGFVALVDSAATTAGVPAGDVTAREGYIDALGFGTANKFETATIKTATSNPTSYQRDGAGTDTDNNAVDFTVADATPMYSGGSALIGDTDPDPDPTDPPTDEPTTPPVGAVTPIAEIQGTGATTPLMGQKVTTEGYVTAVYKTGGFNGFYLQTQGTGGTHEGDASHGIFVYAAGNSNLQSVEKGQFLRVTGTAGEYSGLTQISNPTWTTETAPDTYTVPVPVTFDVLPAGDAAREKYEGMLVSIEGDYTITNNYNTGRYGSLGLAPGLAPLLQPSQVYNPTLNPTEIKALDETNKAVVVELDDGLSWDLTNFNQNNDQIPVPYLSVNNPARVGAQVDFLQPMIVDYRNNVWKFQPTEPINLPGADDPANYIDNTDKWVDFVNNERPAAPAGLGSDVTLATFNVLNYFTTTAADVGCRAVYSDRDGKAITARSCDPRGAANEENLERQEQKIVAAINALDATVVGLEEIENSRHFTPDRDTALNNLVEALNADAGYAKWAAVPSPTAVPANEDVIRLAFIYQPAVVEPVGESKILIGNAAISGTAREPLAQEFAPVDGEETFVAVVNHFKSKGSLTNPGDEDYYQGNNNLLRVEQAKATRAWVEAEYQGKPIFIIGDLNSYGMEDPILEFTSNGYTDTTTETGKYTYQFGGLVGSLDYILANEAAMALVTGVDIWEINADEPLAFEYSRYNYNVKYRDLYDATAFRSSDHDPIIVGINLQEDQTPEVITVTDVEAPYYAATSEGVIIPTTEGVEYLVDGEVVTGTVPVKPGQSVTVTARALEGYEIADGVTTSWDISVDRPAQPEAVVEYGDWVDGEANVEERTVNQTREVTTTEYVWNAETLEWEKGEPVVTTETQTRAMTSDEVRDATPKPEADVEYGDWQDTAANIGDRTFTQERTVTTTDWVWNSEELVWEKGEPVVTTETQTRAMTADEIRAYTPQPEAIIQYGEWTDTTVNLEDRTVNQTREVTTTVYVWNTKDLVWEKGEPVVTTETQTRAMTPEEILAVTPQPQADVEYGDWVDGEANVEKRTVNQTREVTTTEYVWNAETLEWELGEPVVTEQFRVRDMTQEEIDALTPPAPTCEVMDRPTVLARATDRFGEATGDAYADVWAVNTDGELHFYKGYRGGISHVGIVDCDFDVTSMTKISDVNDDDRADFIARHADGTMNFYYSIGDGFLRYGGQVGHGWNGMDNIIYAGKLGNGDTEYVVARQNATGDLYRYKLTDKGLTGTTKIGHGWNSMDYILSVGNIVGSGYNDVIGITKDGKMIAYEGLKDGSIKTHGQIGHGWKQFDDAFVPGDLTNDGRLDLIGVRGDGRMFLYANTGAGWFAPAKQIGHGWSAMEIMN